MSNINTEQSRKLMNNLIEKMAMLKYSVVFKGALSDAEFVGYML